MARLTTREIEARRREGEARAALIAYIEESTVAKAAKRLHCSESTLRRRLREYMVAGEYDNLVQAAYWLDR